MVYFFKMHSIKVEPKYNSNPNPRIGLIALASDFMIEKDFINVIKNREIDFFVNRIECYNPLTSENLIKMSEKVTEVTKDILPDQRIDCERRSVCKDLSSDIIRVSKTNILSWIASIRPLSPLAMSFIIRPSIAC